jgi:hypothetical protein
MKKAFASIAVAFALAFGLAAAGSVIEAKPAQAYSGSYDYYQCSMGYLYYYKWRDYSWWDEFWYFKKDGYEVVAIERNYWC